MKTIEIKIGGQPAQFTTKSLTFNGKEYFYSNMTSVMNDDENHNYAFAYDGQVIVLPYEAKDSKILNAIFGQVRNLPKKNAAPTAAAKASGSLESASPANQTDTSGSNLFSGNPEAVRQTQPESIKSEPIRVSEIVEPSEAPTLQNAEASEQKSEKEQHEPDTPSQDTEDLLKSNSEAANAAPSGSSKLSKEEKRAEKERIKAEKKAEKERMKAAKAELKGSGSSENKTRDPEKKEKLKKSFIVFGIIIAAFVLISVVYYFVIGTSSNPNLGPNSTESQQYDDIDELINDLQ